jgi:HEAT repeat protein
MSDSNAKALEEDLEFIRMEMKPVVEAFREKYGDDVPRLIGLIGDSDTIEAGLAIKRLADLEAREAVEPLIRLVEAPQGCSLAYMAIIVLGQLGDLRAVLPLINVVESAELRAERETETMRPSAGWRGLLSLVMAGSWWREIRESSRENVRLIYLTRGMHALGQLGDTRAIEPIRKRLDDSDERVQAVAVEALQKLKAV